MKSAGIVKVSGVKNVGDVVRYNEQEEKISGEWHGQDHRYTPNELCTYQGASANGGVQLNEKGRAFIRNGINNYRLYHMMHPQGHLNVTRARTFVQSFDYSLNPQLSPGDVHAMGEMFSDELRGYFQGQGRPVNDALVSTHLDRAEPKVSYTDDMKILQPHLHNHVITHSFNTQGEALSPLLRKSNMHDFQELNDNVVDRFDLKDYRFAKLQQMVFPMSAKTDYRSQLDHGSLSNMGRASQRFLNANRNADGRYPNDFKQARRYRDQLLKSNFGYRTKEVAELRSASSRRQTSRSVFTMDDFVDKHDRPMWYSTKNLRLLRWRNRRDATVERFITRLDFNRALNLTPTHREYQKSMRYAVQADQQGQRQVQKRDRPGLKMQSDTSTGERAGSKDDVTSHIQYYRDRKTGRHSYLVSLQSIFQRVRKEEEKIKRRANAYVQRVKAQIAHVKSRLERRKRAREGTNNVGMSPSRNGLHHREDEIYQYITFYGTDRRGRVRPQRVKQRIHPQTGPSPSERPTTKPRQGPSSSPKKTYPRRPSPRQRPRPRRNPHW